MALDIFKLIGVSLIPVCCAVILIILRQYTKFGKIKKLYQTIVASTVFSITCILGTVLSVKTSTGALINVRDASPIIAGLIFGGPAGIISGLVGGLYRFVAAFWDSSLKTTQIACAVSTAVAGIFTALIRKFIFNNHHGKWYYGAFIAILVEDFHMLMVFITNLNNTTLAYQIIQSIFIQMLLTNMLAVCAAVICASFIIKEKFFDKPNIHRLKLTTKVQLSLAGLLVIAYALVSTIAYVTVYSDAQRKLTQTLDTAISDLKGSVDSSVDFYLYEKVRDVAETIDSEIALTPPSEIDAKLRTFIYEIQEDFGLSEINIVKKDNFIKYSTQGYDDPPYDMGDPTKAQSYEFVCLNEGTEYYIQPIREPSSGKQERTKYAGHVLSENDYNLGFVQIGLFEDKYYKLLDEQVAYSATFRHIDQEGFIAVTNGSGDVVSISSKTPIITHIDLSTLPDSTDKEYVIKVDEKTSNNYYTKHVIEEGYYIISFASVNETLLPARISFMCITLVEIFAFMTLYFVIYIVIKNVITNRIENIGGGLQKITNGDLTVRIDERNSFELDALSDNINKTVDSLKEYTRKEAEKNAKELSFAKMIQHSVLPTVIPLHDKFEIFASMDTAKEVGGDFYDFFFVDKNHLVIEVADVSGKGVPAALFMMQSKTIIKNLVESGMPINEAYTEANRRLCESNEAQMFVTAWIGVINLNNGHIEYVNAGHNPPVVCDENGNYVYLKSRAGFVLGGYDGFKYQLQSFDIRPGEKIYLYTDGVTEAMNKDHVCYGEERLLKIINENKHRGVATICNQVKGDVAKHVDGEEQSDDITMLCFGINGKEATNAMVIDAKLENISIVTDYVDNLLIQHGCNQKAKMEIDVALDEIFSNICHYAYKPDQTGKAKIFLDFSTLNKVAIVFEDCGVAYNPLEKPDPNSHASLEERQIGGLGIYIVKKTMDSMEYRNTNGHNVLKLVKTIK